MLQLYSQRRQTANIDRDISELQQNLLVYVEKDVRFKRIRMGHSLVVLMVVRTLPRPLQRRIRRHLCAADED